eukprot:gene24352-45080_t
MLCPLAAQAATVQVTVLGRAEIRSATGRDGVHLSADPGIFEQHKETNLTTLA